MTSSLSTLSLFPPKPARVFRFLWVGQTGPRVKLFSSIEAFSGYVGQLRKFPAAVAVEFRNPTLCVGVLL